ncbi:MAG: O-succinylbenzoic acid--CoA ligase [Flavobacterium sp.]|nr:MAG: O-succinylbenzoic acid--CoA ligase [Flavobacterium sp.]
MEFTTNIHPSFKLNGQRFNALELAQFAKELEKSGSHYEIQIGLFLQQWLDENESVIVKTSGSTGTPKEIQLSKQQMMNSAKATEIFFKLPEKTTALLCLPSNYIAGKMMLVRAMVLGWNLHIVAPEKDAITQYDNEYDFVAMVPYQVHHSIKSLNKIKKLIIGGGAISEKLNQELQNVNTEVFATYGMTETITHIAVRRINGLAKSNEYTALPNVKFSLNENDCLVIEAPEVSNKKVFTNDMVRLNSSTTFEYLGRIDNVINSGGIKLFPEQIEAKLSPYIDCSFIIAPEKDEELGERLILILENESNEISSNISEAFQYLNSYERPKKIYTFSKFPFTETGKIKRSEVIQILKSNK